MSRPDPGPARRWLTVSVLAGLLATGASGAERSVTDPGDTLPGGAPGQLRKAIADAGSGDVLVIQVSQPIVLSGLELAITGKAIGIQGASPAAAIIDGGGLSRVFDVAPGAALALSGITVRGGAAEVGGGLFNQGTLTLVNVEVTGNHTTSEGAGLIGNGGGIASPSGTLTLIGVTVAGNQARKNGGGIDASGTFTVVNTTVSGNTAVRSGGGIAWFLGTGSLTNVTVTDNTADTGNGGSGQGGGLRSDDTLVMRDTLLAGNRIGPGPGPDCSDAVTSLGHNLIGNPTGCFLAGTGPGDVTGAAPGLGPLGANGGPTRTHAVLAGSAALDRGDAACAATDQRGVPRPQNGRCDIGAFERGGSGLGSLDFDGDGVTDLVVGAGRGVEPRVRVVSGATGAELLSFLAYDTPARASPGVRVATCDLTGDGVPDIVTAPGGGPILVRTFDGTTGVRLPAPLGEIVVTRLTARGPGATVACADVSGDGVPDILLGLPAGPGGVSQILSFSGVNGSPLGQQAAIPGVAGEVFLAP